MDVDKLAERLVAAIQEATLESLHVDNLKKNIKADQDNQAVIERNHENIKAASNKEILRKQLELLAEYSRVPEGHEHMAECSVAMILLYRELTRPDNGWLSQKKSEAKQYEHK